MHFLKNLRLCKQLVSYEGYSYIQINMVLANIHSNRRTRFKLWQYTVPSQVCVRRNGFLSCESDYLLSFRWTHPQSDWLGAADATWSTWHILLEETTSYLVTLYLAIWSECCTYEISMVTSIRIMVFWDMTIM